MRRGFTLVELLVVIAIIAVLIAVLFPATCRVRRAATRMQCQNNLRQLGLGIEFHRQDSGHFPPGTVLDTQLPPDQRLSFHAALLPYIEQDAIHKQLQLKQTWDSDANRAAVGDNHLRIFICPDWMMERGLPAGVNVNGHLGVTTYVGVAGVGLDVAMRPAEARGIGMFGYDRTLKLEQVKDGTSNTAMITETGTDIGPWMRGGVTTVRGFDPNGGQLSGDGLAFGGTHFLDATLLESKRADGFHLLLVDGSVRYTQNAVHPDLLLRLATIADGDYVPANW